MLRETRHPKPSLTVVPVPGKGRGVVAARRFLCGELVDAAPVVVIPGRQWKLIEHSVVGRFCFGWDDVTDSVAVALSRMSLLNHSYTPNVVSEKHVHGRLIILVTLRDIEPGEELTLNYNGDPQSRDASAVCCQGGVVSSRMSTARRGATGNLGCPAGRGVATGQAQARLEATGVLGDVRLGDWTLERMAVCSASVSGPGPTPSSSPRRQAFDEIVGSDRLASCQSQYLEQRARLAGSQPMWFQALDLERPQQANPKTLTLRNRAPVFRGGQAGL